MPVVAILVSSVLIGWMAQAWKGRTGALWATIAFVLQFVVAFINIWIMVESQPRVSMADPAYQFATTVIAIVVGGGIAAVMVASLPTKRLPHEPLPSEARKPSFFDFLYDDNPPRRS